MTQPRHINEPPERATWLVREKSARRRFIERATIMGLGFSLAVHLVIMLIAALVTVDFGYKDAGGTASDDVGFAVLTSADLAQAASPVIRPQSVEVSAIATEAISIDMLSDTQAHDSADELADSIAPNLRPGSVSLMSIDATTGSAGAGSGDGASFFGLEAQGRRFAYIVDISGSMDALTGEGVYTRWELTRSELMRSIEGLNEHAEFYIVLYSSNAMALFGNGEWTMPTPGNLSLTATTLLSFEPHGGTVPLPAFEMVFKLDPMPDAVYFMTDGLFDTGVPDQIRQLNRRELTPVHCVLFGELADEREARAAVNMLSGIARYSGGKFTHIKEARP